MTETKSAICLVAHPDDEIILCGGALALLAVRGVAVHVVCLTRGEGGELGEPPLATRERLGDVREAEMVNAVQALGGKSLTFLGYVDPTVGPDESLFAPVHDPVVLAGQIINCVKQFRPQVLLTHGSNGEYGHPAHKLLHDMSRVAIASLIEEKYAPVPAWWTFAAAYLAHPYPRLSNADDPADLIVEVASVLDRKEAAARCHTTQNALFVRRRSEQAGRTLTVREVLLPEESFRRHWPTNGPGVLETWLNHVTRQA
ncbi:MAG: PIG-L deacetylase family protein [Anaerolineales bacterium]